MFGVDWGGKYMPSVLYKMRMLTVQEGLVESLIPTVGGLDTATKS